MRPSPLPFLLLVAILSTLSIEVILSPFARAQEAPYDGAPPAEAPYYRVRYEGSEQVGALIYPVQYTVWIPPGVGELRGLVVHQHGCGEGSCKSGQTGAFDLHWQALAKQHGCALLSPSYEQPEKADCQKWCDPRNGSGASFERALVELGAKSDHPELATVPWALWGHSGGGHWCGAMALLHPDRVAAAWLRSGVPPVEANPKRPSVVPHDIDKAALAVPILCNLGTREGVTETQGRFSGVWPANQKFFSALRRRGGLVGVAVDPLTSHECGNQRYLAIPWLDACLAARLPEEVGGALRPMPADEAWLAAPLSAEAFPASDYAGDPDEAAWLPNERIARARAQYLADTAVSDSTPPPPPSAPVVKGSELTWTAEADLESGLARFHIERDGKRIGTVPKDSKNPFGRPLFQGLQYSDTPLAPLVEMRFTDPDAEPGTSPVYRIVSENTLGLTSAK